MKNAWKGLVFTLFCIQPFLLSAQQIITATKIKIGTTQPTDSIRDVNTFIFLPKGFEKVIHPMHYKQDDKGKLVNIYNSKEDVDSAINNAFNSHVYFKKDGIFISADAGWVTLSSFFEYSNDDTSKTIDEAIENARKQRNAGFINYKQDWRIGADSLLEAIPSGIYKTLNADTAFLLSSKYQFKYQSGSFNYKCIVLYLIKYDLGTIAVKYFYPTGQEKEVFDVINNTWGVVQFKPDNAFKGFTRENVMPKQTEPELYFGKFSALNNPDQLKREITKYKQRQLRNKSQKVGRESVPLVHAKQYDAAKAKLREALRIDTTNGNLYNQLIFVALFQNQMDSAWYFWNKEHDVEPHAFNLWLTKGMLQTNSNQLDSAAVTYENMLLSDSMNLLVYQNLIGVYAKLGNTDKLKGVFVRINQTLNIQERKKENKEPYTIFNNNQLAQIKLEYAKFLLKQQEPDSAIALVNGVIDLSEKLKSASAKASPASSLLPQLNSPVNSKTIAEAYFILGLAYGINHENDKAKGNLLKAKELGWEIPEQLQSIIE